MPTFSLLGKAIDLPATPMARRETIDRTAWELDTYITVQLKSPIEALRLHTNGRSFLGRDASNEGGAWLLIGDVIMPLGRIADSRSLPVNDPSRLVAATHVSVAHLTAFSVLNIGVAAKKFGGRGGELQAEYVKGQAAIRFTPLEGKRWHTHEGRA